MHPGPHVVSLALTYRIFRRGEEDGIEGEDAEDAMGKG